MKLIIDIPDHLYKLLKDLPSDSNEGTIENVLMKAVENGIPLPKKHGRLIDADELNEQEIPAIKKDGVVYVKLSTLQDLIDNAPTIIDADGSQET